MWCYICLSILLIIGWYIRLIDVVKGFENLLIFIFLIYFLEFINMLVFMFILVVCDVFVLFLNEILSLFIFKFFVMFSLNLVS